MFLLRARYLVPKGFEGLTIFPFVLIRDAKREKDLVFLNHERIHIRQQAELFVVVFFVWYLTEFLIRLLYYRKRDTAYRNISFEREAYANEKDLNYLKSRSFWEFIKYM